jgi:hypothetical protein
LAELKGQLSYTQLAQKVNARLAELLQQCADYLPQLDKELDESANRFLAHIQFSVLIAEADNLLTFCQPRLTEEERGSIFHDAFERIRAGDQPFSPSYPVIDQDIKERLKYWKSKHLPGEETR